jgi:hypothetical protein
MIAGELESPDAIFIRTVARSPGHEEDQSLASWNADATARGVIDLRIHWQTRNVSRIAEISRYIPG